MDLRQRYGRAEAQRNAVTLRRIFGFPLPPLSRAGCRARLRLICGRKTSGAQARVRGTITAVQNAILARTGLITYSGPHWSSFGMRDHFEQTQSWFAEVLFGDGSLALHPAEAWTDDLWFIDQDNRAVHPGEGWWPLAPGQAAGRIVGGNLCTLNLLQGTEYMPSLDGALLMIEDDAMSDADTFARDLTSLLQQPGAAGVQGVVIGRFQEASRVSRHLLEQIIARQDRLAGLPVLGNVDFGHTNPLATFPIGGQASLTVGAASSLCIADA